MFIIRLLVCLSIIVIIVVPPYYCQLFRLLRLFLIIAFIVLNRIIVLIEIIGIYMCLCWSWLI